MPQLVRMGDETLRDGVDILAVEFLRRLREGGPLPTTSQPPPAAFAEVYGRLAESSSGIVSVHISSRLSGTLNSAALAAREVGLQVEMVDSLSASMGLGFLAVEAAERARRGEPLETIVEAARATIPRTGVYAALDTLEFLRRGGRVGSAAAVLGTLLSVKPLITLREGVVAPLDKPRTTARALQRLRELVEEEGPLERLAILHAGAPELAERLRELLGERAPPDTLTVSVGPTIATHAGPGVVGVAFVRR